VPAGRLSSLRVCIKYAVEDHSVTGGNSHFTTKRACNGKRMLMFNVLLHSEACTYVLLAVLLHRSLRTTAITAPLLVDSCGLVSLGLLSFSITVDANSAWLLCELPDEPLFTDRAANY
jgi:hypothetical protein